MINVAGLFGWNIEGITNSSELVFAQGDTTGYGLHGDFFMGWLNRDALQQSFANCFTNDDCPWRTFGSPDGTAAQPVNRPPDVPGPWEDIGAFWPMDALPGNNPVYTPVAQVTSAVPSVLAAASVVPRKV